ncbi:MAG: succinate--CoA ligase subunit beta [Candidatus Latescibacteria bacterium]|nr:succinate--CoA ligase subunit beta [Candidatus Latescibacterota bacterium]NIM22013.1 succinate--CoA ligase subunit beta [Candidatus Latescibacterota bacterium]NIM66031.1 succinate--CoA ligase subunit beta [Candidatus Latescibacterota bacterium]NIO02439.1 succinate--CoA ligase subunit beta [Candidatus Latescibacterota bacterium]NIO29350.1 succinate--CoA ligase subunit beta [Candidatus Latescibacterota bacterium]
MKLREYQAKSVFSDYGIAIPRGRIAKTPEEAADAARKLGKAAVLKPQLGVKGRGKAGGIAFTNSPDEAFEQSMRLFGMSIKGERIRTLLVEEKLFISDEWYIAVTIDYAKRCPVMIASLEGGVEIEETARHRPESIFKLPVNILKGPASKDLAPVASQMGEDTARCLETLYRIFREYECELVEINPLVRTAEGSLIAADAVLNVNEEALFRHENLIALKKQIPVEDPIAEEAAQKSWTYIDLEGNIGVLSSGAGLTMAILDLMHRAGGTPANFLDTAQIDDEGIYEAFDLLSRAKPMRVLLVNMFAGLNRCDELAMGIKRYLADHPTDTPIVVRMIGNLEEEGHQILKGLGILPFKKLEDAIQRAVELSQKRKT